MKLNRNAFLFLINKSIAMTTSILYAFSAMFVANTSLAVVTKETGIIKSRYIMSQTGRIILLIPPIALLLATGIGVYELIKKMSGYFK
jgi:hypothetical protein